MHYIKLSPVVNPVTIPGLQVLNTGRLLKCSQSYAEENEGLQKQAVTELARRMQQLESAQSSSHQHQLQWEAAQDTALQVTFTTWNSVSVSQTTLHSLLLLPPTDFCQKLMLRSPSEM